MIAAGAVRLSGFIWPVLVERVYMRLRSHNHRYEWLFLLLPFFLSHAQENLVVNGDFSDISGWNELGQYNQGAATGTIDNGAYVIAISEPGTDVWSIQFTQSGITLDSGVAYTLSCTVSATIERTIEVSLSEDGGAYTSYSGRDTLHLSSGEYRYEKMFVMRYPTDTNTRLEFNCGMAGGSITLRDVKEVSSREAAMSSTP